MKEVKVLEGMLNAQGLRFGIVVSRFNEFFTSKLLGGALDALHRHGASEDDITVAWVPASMMRLLPWALSSAVQPLIMTMCATKLQRASLRRAWLPAYQCPSAW